MVENVIQLIEKLDNAKKNKTKIIYIELEFQAGLYTGLFLRKCLPTK